MERAAATAFSIPRSAWERGRGVAILHPVEPAEPAGTPAPSPPRSCMTRSLTALLAVAAGATLLLLAPGNVKDVVWFAEVARTTLRSLERQGTRRTYAAILEHRGEGARERLAQCLLEFLLGPGRQILATSHVGQAA